VGFLPANRRAGMNAGERDGVGRVGQQRRDKGRRIRSL
jgi:hypothetical protein